MFSIRCKLVITKSMSSPHLTTLLSRVPALESCAAAIEESFDIFHASLLTGGKLLLCGNGGSASDAEHWAGELLKGFVHRRPLTATMAEGLPAEVAANLQWA